MTRDSCGCSTGNSPEGHAHTVGITHESASEAEEYLKWRAERQDTARDLLYKIYKNQKKLLDKDEECVGCTWENVIIDHTPWESSTVNLVAKCKKCDMDFSCSIDEQQLVMLLQGKLTFSFPKHI